MTYDLTTLAGRLRAAADGHKLTADRLINEPVRLHGDALVDAAGSYRSLDVLSDPHYTNWRIWTEPRRDMGTDPRRGDVCEYCGQKRTVFAVTVEGVMYGEREVSAAGREAWADFFARGQLTPVTWAEDSEGIYIPVTWAEDSDALGAEGEG